jgi:hypothetical protein
MIYAFINLKPVSAQGHPGNHRTGFLLLLQKKWTNEKESGNTKKAFCSSAARSREGATKKPAVHTISGSPAHNKVLCLRAAVY